MSSVDSPATPWPQRIRHASGSGTAGPVWGEVFHRLQHRLKDRDFVAPPPRIVHGEAVPVPDVRGLDVDRARRVLRDAGLGAVVLDPVHSARSAGTVVRVRPGSGTRLWEGQLVGLTPSDGVRPAPPPARPSKKKSGAEQPPDKGPSVENARPGGRSGQRGRSH